MLPAGRLGVEEESGDSVGGFVSLYPLHNWIPAPRFHEDKLRGNDRRGCEGFIPAEGLAGVFHLHFDERKGVQRGKAPLPKVWGCPPNYPISPPPPRLPRRLRLLAMTG